MADADTLREPASGVIPSDPVPPTGDAGMPEGSVMTLVDHLSELRDRLVKCIVVIAIGTAIGFYFAPVVRNFLLEPLPNGQAQVLGPGDGFAIQLRIAVVIGIIIAMPVLLYQVWAFIAPGLYKNERRYVGPFMFSTVGLFLAGGLFAYNVTMNNGLVKQAIGKLRISIPENFPQPVLFF